MKLTIERRLDGDRLLMSLAGSIDEHADLSPFASIDRNVDVDLAGVQRINSFGIREWMRALRGIGAHHRVRLFRCPPILVDQANMVRGFFEPGVVVSFYVPMLCEECDASSRALVERQRFEDQGLPELPCKHCHRPLAIDDWEEHYFGFLR